MAFTGQYLTYLEMVHGVQPVYFDQVYRRQYLQGQPIADIAKQYDWSLSDTAADMQKQAIEAHRRRQEVELARESHWWYRLWCFLWEK